MIEAAHPLYVDVTELVVLDLRTGIQRVVRELVEHGSTGASPRPIVPVIAVDRHFHALTEAGWQRMRAPGSGVGEKRITHERGVSPLVRAGKRLAKVHDGLYNTLQRLWVRRTIRRRARGLYAPAALPMGAGDTLVLLDSFWGGSATLTAARRARDAGTRVVLVVYDLIPMTHPQFCDARLVQKFAPLMARATAISDRVLAISRVCADSVEQAFAGVRATAFPLGHDLRVTDGGAASITWPPALWDGGDRVFVIVGSIEPRKGHETVLDAFERRWARGSGDRLLVIGKVGWQVEALMARIDAHPEAGRRLFHVHNATDAMLADALGRADAGIIASFVEGFGLPLAESLAAGLPVIASDIPVFHEIADDAALYFTPGDPAALDEAIDRLHRDFADRRARAAGFRWPGWREAAARFFADVEAPASNGVTP